METQCKDQIDLQKFCAEDFPPRIATPFSRGDYTWATDGKVMVRVPRRSDVPERDDAPHVERIWPEVAPAFVSVMRKKPFPKPNTKDCRECDGRGTVHDCPDCACVCEACYGAGREERDSAVSFRGRSMGLGYARLLTELPGLEIEAQPEPAPAPLRFRFYGGEGALMLLREEHNLPVIADLEEAA